MIRMRMYVMLAAVSFMLTACSSSTSSIVEDFEATECIKIGGTRAGYEDLIRDETLTIERIGDALYCQWLNYSVGCSISDISVNGAWNGNTLSITAHKQYPKIRALCSCYVNMYFSIEDATQDDFTLVVYETSSSYPKDRGEFTPVDIDLTGHSKVALEPVGRREGWSATYE